MVDVYQQPLYKLADCSLFSLQKQNCKQLTSQNSSSCEANGNKSINSVSQATASSTRSASCSAPAHHAYSSTPLPLQRRQRCRHARTLLCNFRRRPIYFKINLVLLTSVLQILLPSPFILSLNKVSTYSSTSQVFNFLN